MEVTLAKSAGFCFGVKRAVNVVYQEIEKAAGRPIYTYGPIIHNAEVVRDLEAKGVTVVNSIGELKSLPKGTVIIRSHGITKEEDEAIREAGFAVVDATCPFVTKIHRLVEEYSAKGYFVVIAGNAAHPEVIGIKSRCVPDAAAVVGTEEEAENLRPETGKKVCIVSQTTFNYNKFQELVEIIGKKGYDNIVLNTICNATEERQKEARRIAGQSEAMIVIGDKNSSNTQKLFEICKKECENTYYIQTGSDMDYSQLQSIKRVGITAGASTPNNIIEEVSKNVRDEL